MSNETNVSFIRERVRRRLPISAARVGALLVERDELKEELAYIGASASAAIQKQTEHVIAERDTLHAALWRYVSGDSCDCTDGAPCRFCTGRDALNTTDADRLAGGPGRLQTERDTLRAALILAVEAIGTDMHYVPAVIEQQIRAALGEEPPVSSELLTPAVVPPRPLPRSLGPIRKPPIDRSAHD